MELSDAAIGAILATGVILLLTFLLCALVCVNVWLSYRKVWIERDDDGEVRAGMELRAPPVRGSVEAVATPEGTSDG